MLVAISDVPIVRDRKEIRYNHPRPRHQRKYVADVQIAEGHSNNLYGLTHCDRPGADFQYTAARAGLAVVFGCFPGCSSSREVASPSPLATMNKLHR